MVIEVAPVTVNEPPIVFVPARPLSWMPSVFEPDVVQEEVSLEFQLPGSTRVLRADGVTLAEHRWARAHGVRFTRIAEEDRVLIDAFLRGELRDDAVAL